MTSARSSTERASATASSKVGPKVAVIGLGRMGSAAAGQLGQHFSVTGWDLRAVEIQGVESAQALEETVAGAEVVLAFLPTANETRRVLEDASFRRALDSSSAVFVDASTSSPYEIKSLAAGLQGAADRVLDAPILGRPESVGEWTMPVGGSAMAFEVARPVLEVIASRVFHVGELGSGHTVKLLNNMMFAAINVITAEALGACEWLNVDPAKFTEIVGGSTAATVSPLFRALAPRMVGEEMQTVFTVALLDKDLRLAVEMCRAVGVPLVSAPVLQEVTRVAMNRGLATADSAALVELYRRPATQDD